MNKKEILIFFLIFLLNFIISEDECSKYFNGYKYLACYNVPLSKEGKHCSYLNGNCIEQVDQCEDYKGSNADECKAIIPSNDLFL